MQNLQRVSPKAKDVDFKVGRSAQNVSKNRYQENVVSKSKSENVNYK